MLTSADIAAARALIIDTMDNVVLAEWSKPVRLVYAQISSDCPNCIEVGPYGTTNQYKEGGPLPFSVGQCPYCMGIGTISDKPHKDTVARIRQLRKEEYTQELQLEQPESIIVLKGKMSDLEDFRRVEYLIVNPDFQPEQRYVKHSEPVDKNSIAQNLYFEMYWKRV